MSPTRRERIELERQVLNDMMMGGSHSESQSAASASNPGEPSIQQQAVQRGVTQLDVQKPDTQSAPPVALDVKALELSIEQMESQKAHAVRCEDFDQAHKAKLAINTLKAQLAAAVEAAAADKSEAVANFQRVPTAASPQTPPASPRNNFKQSAIKLRE